MKKYFLGLVAISFAVAGVAFTAPKNPYYFQYNGSGAVTSISNYTQVQNPPTCPSGTAITCYIETNTTSPTLTDSDSDGFADINSSVTSLVKKRL